MTLEKKTGWGVSPPNSRATRFARLMPLEFGGVHPHICINIFFPPKEKERKKERKERKKERKRKGSQ